MTESEFPQKETNDNQFYLGAATSIPITLSVFAVGLVVGVLAAEKGLTFVEAFLFSALVFAGSAQFIALELWGTPLAITLIVFTTLIVNLRHMLMSAAITPEINSWPKRYSFISLLFLADEIWAVAMTRARRTELRPSFYFGLALPFYLVWITSTLTGHTIGRSIGDPAMFGVDFAFTAVFLALLIGLWNGRSSVLPWIAAALATLAIDTTWHGPWPILIGALSGTLVGALQYGYVKQDDTVEKNVIASDEGSS